MITFLKGWVTSLKESIRILVNKYRLIEVLSNIGCPFCGAKKFHVYVTKGSITNSFTIQCQCGQRTTVRESSISQMVQTVYHSLLQMEKI